MTDDGRRKEGPFPLWDALMQDDMFGLHGSFDSSRAEYVAVGGDDDINLDEAPPARQPEVQDTAPRESADAKVRGAPPRGQSARTGLIAAAVVVIAAVAAGGYWFAAGPGAVPPQPPASVPPAANDEVREAAVPASAPVAATGTVALTTPTMAEVTATAVVAPEAISDPAPAVATSTTALAITESAE